MGIRLLMMVTLLASLIFPREVAGTEVEKRVFFPRGRSGATYKGKLPERSDYDSYFFPAKKGQLLTVKLTSEDPEAYLAIYETKQLGPAEDTILANNERSREWSGRLPVNGEYSVQVYDAVENGLIGFAYKIQISLR